MKKLWNKFINFFYKKEEWTKEDEEYFVEKLVRRAVKNYNPWEDNIEVWVPLRAKKEKDNV